MSAIVIRFVGGRNDLVSRLIMADSGGHWAVHTEALFPAGWPKIGGQLIGAHIDGGVMARPPGYDAGFGREEYVTIPTDTATAVRFYGFMASQIGKPYDMEVIAALAASTVIGARDWRQDDSWICSELIAAACEAAAIFPKLAIDINHLTPRDDRLILSVLGY